MSGTNVIQQVDILDILKSIGKKKKKLQAILLQELETVIPKESPEYNKMRKVILDETSDYARAVVKSIFGDIEVFE
jgi:hypothetical protein